MLISRLFTILNNYTKMGKGRRYLFFLKKVRTILNSVAAFTLNKNKVLLVIIYLSLPCIFKNLIIHVVILFLIKLWKEGEKQVQIKHFLNLRGHDLVLVFHF